MWCLMVLESLLSFFLSSDLFLPIYCRCRGLLLHLVLLNDTLGRTPLDEGIGPSQKPLPHKRPTAMIPAELEPAIPASKSSETYALDRAATG